MAEFVAFDNNVEVSGQSMLSVLNHMGDRALPIIKKYGFPQIDPDEWYPQQAYLDAYKEINETVSPDLVAIGMQVPDFAIWPPEIDSVEKALDSLNIAYHMNHRGGEIGGYFFEKTGEREGKMVCRNPYPSDFDYGLIYRLAQKFRSDASKGFQVVRDDSIPNRKTGADECTYHIEW